MEQSNAAWNAENDATRGEGGPGGPLPPVREAIPPDEDTEDTTDTSRAGYPQTYLHKVASARPGSGSENTAAEDTAPQDTVPDNETPGDIVAEHRTAETNDDEAYVTENRDETAAVRDTTPAGPDTPGETGYLDTAGMREPADAAGAEDVRDVTGTGHASSDTAASDPAAWDTVAPEAAAPASLADVPAATTTPDLVPPVATAPAEAETPSMAGPQGRRPGDEPVPPGLSDNLLPDSSGIREQWLRIQAQFVDDPRAAVSEAATLITDVASRLEAAVRERQETLRGRWDGNSRADTEALRVTVQQYRHLLERLAGF